MKGRILSIVSAAALLFVAAFVGRDALEERPDPGQLVALDRTCNHYENRARFLPREEPVPFVVTMADDCRRALDGLEHGDRQLRASAEAYLSRLKVLRDTIGKINSDRIFGPDAGPRAKPKKAAGMMSTMAQVTQSGEFLIAHRMGVVSAHRAWAEGADPYTVAASN